MNQIFVIWAPDISNESQGRYSLKVHVIDQSTEGTEIYIYRQLISKKIIILSKWLKTIVRFGYATCSNCIGV